ncbi:hypothetical protein FNV43_RR02313 [Rhamnella rubrinervis]|uniref:F-box protein PP2-B12 n=1 Tax=Rhamnella rubrinervis TaxID=2594499 RepID=A0A8K0MTZ0_9ROSA|nr:hypothetical protein FNV43_RR02313 [Rhamnella rubrinervis]
MLAGRLWFVLSLDQLWIPMRFGEIFFPTTTARSFRNRVWHRPWIPFRRRISFSSLDHPVVIDNGTMSFAIDKKSGKKCYMIGARRLSIAWGDTPSYWRWRSLPAQSRFLEVAELRFVWWLDIKGRIETNMLSPKTRYAAYFVYKLKERSYGLQEKPVKLRVYFEGEEEHQEVLGHVNGYETSTTSVFLEPPQNMLQQFKERGDGWMEVEMGEFFNDGGEKDDQRILVFSLFEFDNITTKSGLVVEGIELRPKAIDR